MFIAVQIALLVLGLYIMTRGRYEFAGREVTNPMASMVGIVLVGQLPIALLISIVLGLTAEPSTPPMTLPTRAGEVAPSVTVAAPRSTNDFWWVDPLITCGALMLAAGMTAVGLTAAHENDDVYASLRPADADRLP
jgi:hypothetical protein